MENTNLNQNVNTLFTNLEDFTQNQGLIGKPITHENKTFMPIVSVTLGYGSGNTASKAQQMPTSASGKMAGGALGLGAKLSTDAILVIDKENVSMIPVNTSSTAMNASQLMDKIPQMVSSMGQGQQGQQGQQAQQGQGQQTQAKQNQSQTQGQNTQK